MREQEGDYEDMDFTADDCVACVTSSPAALAEQSLWNAVICRAFLDAGNGSKAAREWLLDGGEDFATVCSLAGASAFTVRSAARRIIKPLSPRTS